MLNVCGHVLGLHAQYETSCTFAARSAGALSVVSVFCSLFSVLCALCSVFVCAFYALCLVLVFVCALCALSVCALSVWLCACVSVCVVSVFWRVRAWDEG